MSFKKYGGLNYSAKNNIVQNNYTNANNLGVMNIVGQPDSTIYFESNIVSPVSLFSTMPTMPTIQTQSQTQPQTITLTQTQYDEIITKLNNHDLLLAYLLRENQQLKTQIETLTSQ